MVILILGNGIQRRKRCMVEVNILGQMAPLTKVVTSFHKIICCNVFFTSNKVTTNLAFGAVVECTAAPMVTFMTASILWANEMVSENLHGKMDRFQLCTLSDFS